MKNKRSTLTSAVGAEQESKQSGSEVEMKRWRGLLAMIDNPATIAKQQDPNLERERRLRAGLDDTRREYRELHDRNSYDSKQLDETSSYTLSNSTDAHDEPQQTTSR
ncbi:hypothetical protein M514_13197 [Trichuris suis]|uniref:Uncharacterized protein n=1 Tax=Trichuris suis TaxID=68888 RepID=A0A085LLR6_9BILA|nr:hypothetical protein M513_13197 [Trichuris suis]KFD60587.1 hypothetical protein M514_13197 [Trichuris suis]